MSILFILLALLFAGVLAWTAISGAFAWAVQAGRNPALLEERFRSSSLRLAARVVLTESLCLFVTVLLHPFGLRRERGVRHRPPGTGPAGTPVLLLHGLFHNRTCWWRAKRYLRPWCRGGLYSMNLPPWEPVEALLDRVAERVDELRIALGVERVHLVGHSMGGMLARKYVQGRGAARVDRCVLLGTPNGGSMLAPLAFSPLARLLVPGSPFLRELAEAPQPAGVRFSALYSRHDNLVVPYESARLEGVRNVELSGMGHCALLYHPQALKALAVELMEEPG